MSKLIQKKRCVKCERVLPITDFYRGAKYRDGYRTACKACMNTAHYKYVHGKTLHWRRQYFPQAVDNDEYENLLFQQKDACWGCGKFHDPTARRFSKKTGPDGQPHLYCNGCTWYGRNRFK